MSNFEEFYTGKNPYLPLPSVHDDPASGAYYIINHDRRHYPIKVVILGAVYYILSVGLPAFNYVLFRGEHDLKGYPFPLISTWLQMLGVFVCLAVASTIQHFIHRNDVLQKSWVFGKNQFFWKCKQLFLVSLAFAAVMGLTNWGLFLIDLNVHVLLRGTEIVWVVFFAWIIQKEKPNLWSSIACLVLILGTIFIGLDLSNQENENEKQLGSKELGLSLLVNLLAAFCSGLMIVLLRRSIIVLRERDPTISILEITLFKAAMACVTIFPFTLLLEADGWKSLSQAETQIQLLVLAGIGIAVIYQFVIVGITAFSLATTVGIISQSKILPQVILALAFRTHSNTDVESFTPSGLHISGLILIIISTAFYALLRWRQFKQEQNTVQCVMGRLSTVED